MGQRLRPGNPALFSTTPTAEDADDPFIAFIEDELAGDPGLQRKQQRRGAGKPGWARHVEMDDRRQRHERRHALK